jgi:UDP-2,4-diacetamido-2,4,6-trideoxy-beta-L-altropyranose hydrolase
VTVVFVTRGGRVEGFGHVRRCLTLAEALRNLGAASRFVVNPEPTVESIIADAGFAVQAIERDGLTSWLGEVARATPRVFVADSYELRGEDLARLRHAGRLVVIDDLADREIPADVIVNTAPGVGVSVYHGSTGARLLLGPRYALLRPEFAQSGTPSGSHPVLRVLVTVGGANPGAAMSRFVRWVRAALPAVAIDAVVGPLATESLDLPDELVTVHHHPKSLADLMMTADLALTAGGQVTYELAAMGVPAVLVAVASNQTPQSRAWDAEGAFCFAGGVDDEGVGERVRDALRRLAADAALRSAMSRRGRSLVDGAGAPRVAEAVLELDTP